MANVRGCHFSDDFKLKVLSDYYSSGLSKNFIAHKWGLCGSSVICSWQKAFPIDCKEIGFEDQNKLFCSSDVSDDTKKFVTSFNELIFSGLSAKVTKSAKKYV